MVETKDKSTKIQKDYLMLFNIDHDKVCTYIFLIRPLLEARAEIQKYFHLFFASNENFKICF